MSSTIGGRRCLGRVGWLVCVVLGEGGGGGLHVMWSQPENLWTFFSQLGHGLVVSLTTFTEARSAFLCLLSRLSYSVPQCQPCIS
jgi:hypothetical protein